jgi:hypothetical protein
MRFLFVTWAAITAVCVALLFAPQAHCQTAILLPDPHPQFTDVNGKPLAGGFVFTYLAGTSIQQATYTDSTGSTLNSDPIVLDAGGFPSCAGSSCGIYLTNGISYRIVVQNSLGVQQWVADNVKLVNSAQVGGANTQVQFNCAGAFCGSPNFTWNNGSQTLTVTALTVNAGGSLNGTFGGNPVFSGTVTFGGTVNFNNLTFGSLSQGTSCGVGPASTGQIRLCNLAAINWRNAGNTADNGIQTDAVDRLLVNFGDGLVLTSAVPDISLGGVTAAFPKLHQVGTAVQFKLADASGDAPISASTVTYNGIAGTGVTISGACATGQVLSATSPTAVSCQTQGAAVLQHSLTTNTGTAIGAASQTWITKAITMPATGCPCRAFVGYAMMFTATASGTATCWVEDGTNTFDSNQALTNTAGAGNLSMGCQASGFSTGTYANNATITFVGRGYTTAAGGITVATAGNGSTQASWLDIAILASN